jgi:hypothetical protein
MCECVSVCVCVLPLHDEMHDLRRAGTLVLHCCYTHTHTHTHAHTHAHTHRDFIEAELAGAQAYADRVLVTFQLLNI